MKKKMKKGGFVMKKLLSFVLVFCMLLSVAIFPAQAQVLPSQKYKLVFEEDFENKLSYLKPCWDPGETYGSAAKSGATFSMGKVSIGYLSTVSIVESDDSMEAANFTDGILQFDMTWKAGLDNWLILEFGYKNGDYAGYFQINQMQAYIRRNNGTLQDASSGQVGVQATGFEYGHTYRMWVYLDYYNGLTQLRVHSVDITKGDDYKPDDVKLVAKVATDTNLPKYDGKGGMLRFKSHVDIESMEFDNIKVYVEDPAGDKSEEDIIPNFHKIDNMNAQELLEYFGGPTVEEIKATQRPNGEDYNLVFSEDFSNGNSDPCWDKDMKVLGRQGSAGDANFGLGELILTAPNARRPICKEGKGGPAAAFSRGVISFDLMWEDMVGKLQLLTYSHTNELIGILGFTNDGIVTQHFTAGRILNTGSEGAKYPGFEVNQKYNFKIFAEKDTVNKEVMYKVYIAELVGGKPGKYYLAGWGTANEKMYDYAGGGYMTINNGNFAGKPHIDNIQFYAPADGNVTSESVKITDLIPNYKELEAGIKADEEKRRDEEGIHVLERIGMIIGEGDGVTEKYLKTKPTRVQAAVLTLRLRGLEEEAKAFEGSDNFSDIQDVSWAKNILAYIKAHPELGMVGVGDNCFDPMAPITQQAYVKILLEAMGYKYNEDFSWGEVLSFAKEHGMKYQDAAEFNVREVAKTTYAALYAPLKGETRRLFAKIITDREGINDPEYTNAPALTEEYLAMREEAQHKDYGLMVNYDSTETVTANTNLHFGTPEQLANGTLPKSYARPEDIPKELLTKENYYAWIWDSLIGEGRWGHNGMSQAETIVFSTNMNGLGEELLKVDGEFITRHPTSKVQYYADVLTEAVGMDPVELGIEWCKEHDKTYIWSMRMNDTHDMGQGYEGLNAWKASHLDLLMGKYEDFTGDNYDELAFGFKAWSNADFTHLESRQRLYDTVKYVVKNYDVDGVELDFFRHLSFFKEVVLGEKVYQESIERMNDLIRSIRLMLDVEGMKRGRPYVLQIKIPDSLGFCYNVGLDVDTWMQEDLIDIVGCGGYFRLTEWTDCVDYFQNKYNVPFYACLSRDIINTARNHEKWRNEAAIAWNSGAKGVSTFNILQGDEPILRIIGSPETAGQPTEGYEDVKIQNPGGRGWPGQWFRGGMDYRYAKEAFPEDWSNWTYGQRLYD